MAAAFILLAAAAVLLALCRVGEEKLLYGRVKSKHILHRKPCVQAATGMNTWFFTLHRFNISLILHFTFLFYDEYRDQTKQTIHSDYKKGD